MQVDRDQALRIAREDALTAYRDLDAYDVICVLQDDDWKIDFVPRGRVRGGGPHYVVSGDSGEIVSKYYEQ